MRYFGNNGNFLADDDDLFTKSSLADDDGEVEYDEPSEDSDDEDDEGLDDFVAIEDVFFEDDFAEDEDRLLGDLDSVGERRTENDDLTYGSTGSFVLDLFATIGALRFTKATKIVRRFQKAYAENPDLAMKTLFYSRDVRGGLGERRVFRVIYAWLMKTYPASALKNLRFIPEFGRYDDLVQLMKIDRRAVGEIIARQIDDDMANIAAGKNVSLLGKWLPSINASSGKTRKLAYLTARTLNLTPAQYRKKTSALRRHIDLLENRLRTKDYTFDYSKQPSLAMLRYRDAFWRNDKDRYEKFIDAVERGEAKMNAAVLYPYDVIAPILKKRRDLSDEENRSLEASWKSLPDFTRGENALVVVDGSGSMYNYSRNPMAASVALSLGLYFAERNKGAFKDCFITFSRYPRLVKVEGATLREKVLYAASYDEAANTDLAAVFDLILEKAVKHNVQPEQMPKSIYVISDMEFDSCADGADVSSFMYARRIFRKAGYALPQIIFWNVDSRHNTLPVRANEQGVVLVSGNSPRVFSMVVSGNFDPTAYMMNVLSSERLAPITA